MSKIRTCDLKELKYYTAQFNLTLYFPLYRCAIGMARPQLYNLHL